MVLNSCHTCGVCGLSFHKFLDFLRHQLLNHDAQENVPCYLCHQIKGLSSPPSLRTHLIQDHAVALENTRLTDFAPSQGPFSNTSEHDKSKLLPDENIEEKINSHCLGLGPSQTYDDLSKISHIVKPKLVNKERENPCNIKSSESAFSFKPSNLQEVTKTNVGKNDEFNSDCDFPSTKTVVSTYEIFSTKNSGKEVCNLDLKSDADNCKTISPSYSTTNGLCNRKAKHSVDFYFLFSNKQNLCSDSNHRAELHCLHCLYSTPWRFALVKHMKSAHNEILERHSFLEIKAKHPTSTAETSSPHTLLNNFQVTKISDLTNGIRFRSPKQKRIRKLEHQDQQGHFQCNVCQRVFSRLRYVRRHLKCHNPQRSHLCPICGKMFKTRVSSHRCEPKQVYKCPDCSFTSSSGPEVHRHRQVHPNGAVMCHICGLTYNDRSTLRKHQLVHDPRRPFPCTHPGCTWRFKTDMMRRAHVRAHTIEGKFRCTHCGHKFRHKHHLQRHLAKLHYVASSQPVSASQNHFVSTKNKATCVYLHPPPSKFSNFSGHTDHNSASLLSSQPQHYLSQLSDISTSTDSIHVVTSEYYSLSQELSHQGSTTTSAPLVSNSESWGETLQQTNSIYCPERQQIPPENLPNSQIIHTHQLSSVPHSIQVQQEENDIYIIIPHQTDQQTPLPITTDFIDPSCLFEIIEPPVYKSSQSRNESLSVNKTSCETRESYELVSQYSHQSSYPDQGRFEVKVQQHKSPEPTLTDMSTLPNPLPIAILDHHTYSLPHPTTLSENS